MNILHDLLRPIGDWLYHAFMDLSSGRRASIIGSRGLPSGKPQGSDALVRQPRTDRPVA